jgi:hypothetical protein
MTAHITRFIERIQGFEARGAKDFIMPLSDAKGMHADLTRLLLELNDLKELAVKAQEEEIITVQVGGGSF